MPSDNPIELVMHGHNAVVAVTTFYSEALARTAEENAQLRTRLQTSEARLTIAETELQKFRNAQVPVVAPPAVKGG